MACDHVKGSYGSHLVRESQWGTVCAGLGRAVRFFNTTRLAVPPPGHLRSHAYCSDCGHRLDDAGSGEILIAALDSLTGPAHTRESYMDWLLAPVPTPENSPSAD
tara:strand:+ start:1259 stop:1573 length:315 start_codon:yes stop_codon:yes gene_type:complete